MARGGNKPNVSAGSEYRTFLTGSGFPGLAQSGPSGSRAPHGPFGCRVTPDDGATCREPEYDPPVLLFEPFGFHPWPAWCSKHRCVAPSNLVAAVGRYLPRPPGVPSGASPARRPPLGELKPTPRDGAVPNCQQIVPADQARRSGRATVKSCRTGRSVLVYNRPGFGDKCRCSADHSPDRQRRRSGASHA
jgi:hypothetical protein